MSKMLKEHKDSKPQDETYWINRKIDDVEHDWLDDSVNWVTGYSKSVDHPHREVILDALKGIRFSSLLEVGCNAGPNLMRIEEQYPFVELYGFDVNKDSIKEAKKNLPTASLKVGNLLKSPFKNEVDVVLVDAVLMYISPENIDDAMGELTMLAKKKIIIVDRFLKEEGIAGHVRGRNYTQWLKSYGWKVEVKKITKKQWPTSKNWQKYGRVFVATR